MAMMVSARPSSVFASLPLSWRRWALRAAQRGRARKKQRTATPTAAGITLSRGSLGPGRRPTARPAAKTVITITLTALVSRNSVAERSIARLAGTPRVLRIQTPSAAPPTPPTETAEPKPISASASRAANRRGARVKTSWKARMKPMHERISRAIAAATHGTLASWSCSATPLRPGTAASRATIRTPRTARPRIPRRSCRPRAAASASSVARSSARIGGRLRGDRRARKGGGWSAQERPSGGGFPDRSTIQPRSEALPAGAPGLRRA